MKYSFIEIEQMRDAIREMATPVNTGYHRQEVEQITERRLLTYMANETAPQELEDALVAHRQHRHEALRRVTWRDLP